MTFLAEINVMPLKELLDPQGKTIANNVQNLDLTGIQDVRLGKHIEITIEANSEADAKAQVDTACKKLLANPVMEYYEFTLKSI